MGTVEAPIDADSEDDLSEESVCVLPEEFEDEVDINIHFHCEHCFKLSQCKEKVKPGWCCKIIECVNGCGMKFHECKSEEHNLLCSHVRTPCINAGNGCPHIIQRQFLAEHLPVCPASVVVCNAEWNRWAFGARERERISLAKGVIANYHSHDLDMSLAIDDQRLVNDMHLQPKYLRKLMCNGITRRFPSLPLSIRGAQRGERGLETSKLRGRSQSTTDDEEEGLTPGLSLSVCTELLRGKKCLDKPHSDSSEPHTDSSPKTNKVVTLEQMLIIPLTLPLEDTKKEALKRKDDISAFCCSHGILKDLCKFCRDDPEEPDYKFGNVWREKVDVGNPGVMIWSREPRVEKIRKRNTFGIFTYKHINESDEEDEEGGGASDKTEMAIDEEGRPTGRFRFQTPPPAPLTSAGLTLEIELKHYSRHQVKPKAMFTFHCMQELRRDEFFSHYKNVHSEIQEGLDGWLQERCPLHIIGCPFALKRIYPKRKDGDVVFCHNLRAFGIKLLDKNCNNENSSSQSTNPCDEITQRITGNAERGPNDQTPVTQESDTKFLTSSRHITYLPVEVLQSVARYLDGYSLNNLSLTCHFMRAICFTLLDEKGLVLQEWVRTSNNERICWKLGRNKWFFPKSFEYIRDWTFRDGESMSNHLSTCPFNIKSLSEKKFCYTQLRREELPNFMKLPHL